MRELDSENLRMHRGEIPPLEEGAGSCRSGEGAKQG